MPSSSSIHVFHKVQDPIHLLTILEARHPHSCFIFNQVKMHEGFKDTQFFYTIGKEINANTWIVSANNRGSNVCISAPLNIVAGKEKIGKDIKQCFSSPTNGIINWDAGALFVGLEKPVSKMIFDISVNVMGNVTEVHPCNLYYMEISDAAQVVTSPLSSASPVEGRRLVGTQEEEDFILSTWKYADKNMKIAQTFRVAPSGGVFLNGKCVSAVYTAGYGLLAALYTLKEHRLKGYGRLAMNVAFQESAKDGCVPCLTVEQKNARSIQFNESLGVKRISVVDWIDVQKLEVD